MNALAPWRTRTSPWLELDTLQERLDRMLGLSLPQRTGDESMGWMPVVDLKESDAELLLTAELPGIDEKDVQVDIEENVLTLKGEKRTERDEEHKDGGRWHLIERSHGTFQRSFTLPPAIDAAAIKADFSNGILTVHLPKRKESKARRIAIGGKK